MDRMKSRDRSLILCFVCAFVLLGASIAVQAQNVSDKLCGTWVDETAQFEEYKWVFDPDGKAFRYWRELDTPYYEGRYSIEKKWTDENGNTLYHCYAQWSFPPYAESKVLRKVYQLFMINAAGDTLDAVSSVSNYPENFQSGRHWPIHHRQ